MTMKRWMVVLTMALAMSISAHAANKDKNKDKSDGKKPHGREISNAAKNVKFKEGESIERKKGKGDVVKFIPADLSGLKLSEMQDGQVIGIIELSQPGEHSKIKPGRYHVFAKKMSEQWEVFFERKDDVAGTADQVREQKDAQVNPKFWNDGNGIAYSYFTFCL